MCVNLHRHAQFSLIFLHTWITPSHMPVVRWIDERFLCLHFALSSFIKTSAGCRQLILLQAASSTNNLFTSQYTVKLFIIFFKHLILILSAVPYELAYIFYWIHRNNCFEHSLSQCVWVHTTEQWFMAAALYGWAYICYLIHQNNCFEHFSLSLSLSLSLSQVV